MLKRYKAESTEGQKINTKVEKAKKIKNAERIVK